MKKHINIKIFLSYTISILLKIFALLITLINKTINKKRNDENINYQSETKSCLFTEFDSNNMNPTITNKDSSHNTSKFENKKNHSFKKRKDIFYLSFYYSKSHCPEKHYSDEFTQTLLKLKKNDNQAILYFKKYFDTPEFSEFFIKQFNIDSLFVVPSSTKDKYNNGIYEIAKYISDKYNLHYHPQSLIRKKTLRAAKYNHYENKLEDHLQSLELRNTFQNLKNILILDDITTTRTSIQAVQEKLKEKFNTANFYKFVLGYTYYKEEKVVKLSKNKKNISKKTFLEKEFDVLLTNETLKRNILFHSDYDLDDIVFFLKKFQIIKQKYNVDGKFHEKLACLILTKNISSMKQFSEKSSIEIRKIILDLKLSNYLKEIIELVKKYG